MQQILHLSMMDYFLDLSSFGTGLPVTPLGRGVALVRVTDPPTAMTKEDEEQGRMAEGSSEIFDISPPITVKMVTVIIIFILIEVKT